MRTSLVPEISHSAHRECCFMQCPSCPDPPTCARLLDEKWRQAYQAVFRFGPCQPSMVFRYLRTLEGVSPPLALSHLTCQTTAKAFIATRTPYPPPFFFVCSLFVETVFKYQQCSIACSRLACGEAVRIQHRSGPASRLLQAWPVRRSRVDISCIARSGPRTPFRHADSDITVARRGCETPRDRIFGALLSYFLSAPPICCCRLPSIVCPPTIIMIFVDSYLSYVYLSCCFTRTRARNTEQRRGLEPMLWPAKCCACAMEHVTLRAIECHSLRFSRPFE